MDLIEMLAWAFFIVQLVPIAVAIYHKAYPTAAVLCFCAMLSAIILYAEVCAVAQEVEKAKTIVLFRR